MKTPQRRKLRAPVTQLARKHLRRTGEDDLISRIPFLSCLNETEIAALKSTIIEKQFVKNQIILHEQDTPNCLYFIYTGKVKVIQSSADGKEKMIAIHKRGDFFGEMAMLDGLTAPATVVAMENTRIGLIFREIFHQHLLMNNKVLREIIALLCSRLRDAWSMIKVMSFADAEHRVRAALQLMGERFGTQDPRGIVINIKLTHSDIADFASITRETATRMINRLEKTGEIEALDHKYILLKPAFHKNIDFL
jgi:CRP/FNR family transcriptional regulator, cyclic AMP receptor protein